MSTFSEAKYQERLAHYQTESAQAEYYLRQLQGQQMVEPWVPFEPLNKVASKIVAQENIVLGGRVGDKDDKSFASPKPRYIEAVQDVLVSKPVFLTVAFDTSKSMSKATGLVEMYNCFLCGLFDRNKQGLVGSCLSFGERLSLLGRGEFIQDTPWFTDEQLMGDQLQDGTRLFDAIIKQVEIIQQTVALHARSGLPMVTPCLIVFSDGVDNYSATEVSAVKRALVSIAHLQPKLFFAQLASFEHKGVRSFGTVAMECGFSYSSVYKIEHHGHALALADKVQEVIQQAE
jgi:hypothetical protein